MYKVLLAIRPDDAGVMRRILGDEFEVLACVSLAKAQAALTPTMDMIACGVHFDDGRMSDLHKFAKADSALSHIPFWSVLHDNGALSTAITRGIRTAMKTMGANGLFNLSQIASGIDEDAAFRELRTALQKALAEKDRAADQP